MKRVSTLYCAFIDLTPREVLAHQNVGISVRNYTGGRTDIDTLQAPQLILFVNKKHRTT